jgi:hypothetical protein
MDKGSNEICSWRRGKSPPLKRRANAKLMTDDSLEILWRGSDPAKFTALQAALRDESIPFWQTQVYDPAGGFLSSRPYYLEATPGFEIRVHASDLERANGALKWVESKESDSALSSGSSMREHDLLEARQSLPYAWDSNQATSEVWSGEDEPMAEYLASALRENGIPSRIPDEPGHRVRLCVRPGDLQRARDIAREITGAGSAPPK